MNFIKILISLTVIMATAYAQAQNEPTTTPVSFSKVFVPSGFNNNDRIDFVASGIYPNSCYRYAETTVDVDHANKTITIGATAYMYSGYCLQVILPFDHVVSTGILKQGTYTILSAAGGAKIGQINIRDSNTREPDDFMYAPVSQAFLKTSGKRNLVMLTGDFPMSCMKMKEIKFDIQPDVLVVLPIAEIDKSIPCKEGKFPFKTIKEVGPLKDINYLLHVRSMNGNSVNSVVAGH